MYTVGGIFILSLLGSLSGNCQYQLDLQFLIKMYAIKHDPDDVNILMDFFFSLLHFLCKQWIVFHYLSDTISITHSLGQNIRNCGQKCLLVLMYIVA